VHGGLIPADSLDRKEEIDGVISRNRGPEHASEQVMTQSILEAFRLDFKAMV
jgi:hypothetical protein